MNDRQQYRPGPAVGAHVEKDGETWTLVVVRDLHHAPEKVWRALTEPEHLREWAPFDASRSLANVGTASLTTVGTPSPHVTESHVTRAEEPRLLEYNWGGQDLRWELEPIGSDATRLTLWHSIDRNFISMGAAGWQICFDVLDRFLDDRPIGRIVAGEAMKFEWPRLNEEYAKQFGIEPGRFPRG